MNFFTYRPLKDPLEEFLRRVDILSALKNERDKLILEAKRRRY